MKILVFFDGTGNQPIDAEQNVLEDGSIEDDNITNVLKLHLLAGGDLSGERPQRGAGQIAGQQSLYFSGVGTRGRIVRRLVRKAFAGHGSRRLIAGHGGADRASAGSLFTVANDKTSATTNTSERPSFKMAFIMRYFGGLTREEIAEALTISKTTVARQWRTARAWLFAYLADDGADAR